MSTLCLGTSVQEWDNMAATSIIELSEDNKLLCVQSAVATAVDAHTDSGGLHIS